MGGCVGVESATKSTEKFGHVQLEIIDLGLITYHRSRTLCSSNLPSSCEIAEVIFSICGEHSASSSLFFQ